MWCELCGDWEMHLVQTEDEAHCFCEDPTYCDCECHA